MTGNRECPGQLVQVSFAAATHLGPRIQMGERNPQAHRKRDCIGPFARRSVVGAVVPYAPPAMSVTEPPPLPVRASIVVCTRGRPDMLRTSLERIREAMHGREDTELIVVEQGENPAAAHVCAQLGIHATVVHDPGRGPSRARNLGVSRSRGEIAFFTDDDCEVPPAWIGAHLAAFDDPAIVASFGRVVGLSRLGDESDDPVARRAIHRRGTPPWLVGHSSNMAVRVDAFRDVGGFDERLGPGTSRVGAGEDADLIVRLLRVGAAVSGVGEPVRHMDWRTEDDHRATLLVYQYAAGAWIGKLFREHPREAWPHLRGRIGATRAYARGARAGTDAPVPVPAYAAALARGFLTGLTMSPWRSRPS
jgi:GT2 family glycosyltransferase